MPQYASSLSHQLWMAIFGASVLMLLLLGWSFLYLEPGTASYVIGQVSAIIVVATTLGSLLALYSGWKPF